MLHSTNRLEIDGWSILKRLIECSVRYLRTNDEVARRQRKKLPIVYGRLKSTINDVKLLPLRYLAYLEVISTFIYLCFFGAMCSVLAKCHVSFRRCTRPLYFLGLPLTEFAVVLFFVTPLFIKSNNSPPE